VFKKSVLNLLLFAIAFACVLGFDSLLGNSPSFSYQLSAISTNWSQAISTVENAWEKQYEGYFEEDFTSLSMTPGRISQKLLDLSQETGKKPAVLWLMPTTEQLNLYLITPGKQAIGIENTTVSRRELTKVTEKFVEEISNFSDNYLDSAQQLYRWLIAPVEADLEAADIDTLIMCLGTGLRTLPLAALHDGEQFLIEKYSLTRIPGFNLTQMSESNLQDAKVLAMGATQFKEQVDLPAVEVELKTYKRNGGKKILKLFILPLMPIL
jgi:CHAT domain-containing protein